MEVQNLKHYMDYDGSLFGPVTRARVHYRVYQRSGDEQPVNRKAKVYEEFWYQKETLIGLRRRNKLDIERDRVGIVVVGRLVRRPEDSIIAAKTLVRLLLDLQFRGIVVSSVEVPSESFDEIAGALADLHFYAGSEPEEGSQMSIHLRSDSGGRDEYLYLN